MTLPMVIAMESSSTSKVKYAIPEDSNDSTVLGFVMSVSVEALPKTKRKEGRA